MKETPEQRLMLDLLICVSPTRRVSHADRCTLIWRQNSDTVKDGGWERRGRETIGELRATSADLDFSEHLLSAGVLAAH